MSKITRRARDREGHTLAPMLLGNMREIGIARIELTCVEPGCGFSRSVQVSAWPDEVPVPDVGARFGCPRCGAAELDSRPDWTGFRAPGRGRGSA